MEINYVDLYKDIDFINKELRKSIKQMPRYNRYNEGDRILNLLLDIKVVVKLACKGRNYNLNLDKLYNKLVMLETLIDECIDNGSLLLKGKFTIVESRKRLIALFNIIP